MTDAVAMQAQSDVIIAYNAIAGQACDMVLTGQDLGGLTLTAGVYCFTTSAQLTGTLTLDAEGDPNAVFVFQIGSTLTTASNARVLMTNAGQNCNVFWQVGSSATLGMGTAFVGNILALASVTLDTGSSLSGRALARTGAVTLDTNVVSAPFCVIPAVPTIGKSFSPASINEGSVSTLTLTLINPNTNTAILTAPFIDNLPAGVVIAAVPNAANTCGGAVTAVAGGSTVTLTGGAVPAGAPGACTVTVDVTSAAAGVYLNTIPAGALQTVNGDNPAPALATLTVVAPVGAPTLAKAFSPASINAGSVSTLTITLINPNASPAILTAALIDNLPAGVVIAATPNAANTCGGVVTAVAGAGTVTLTGGAIPAGNGVTAGVCTVTVDVTSALAGSYVNTLPANILQTSNGNNIPDVITTLTVVNPVIDLTIAKTGSAMVAYEGAQFTYTLSVVNSGSGVATGVMVTDVLPVGVTLVSAMPSQGACSGGPTINCNLGDLSPQATATITLVVTIPMKSAGTVISNTAFVVSDVPDINPDDNGTTLDIPVEKIPPGPGLNPPPTSQVSDQKLGSVLVFPFYTSDPTLPGATDTRICITNVENQWNACVHLFLVDGATCSVADFRLCMTPNQTVCFQLSDTDPGTTGYAVAVQVDCMTGCPLNINALIGEEYVKLASGHAANLGAEAIAGLPGAGVVCNTSNSTAELRFDGIMYNQLPRVLALSSIGSRDDGNETMLIVNRIGGDLTSGAATLGLLFGVLYDDAENLYSFNFTAGCQFRSLLNDAFPRTVPRLSTLVPAGRTGWMKFWGESDVGLFGVSLNFNPNVAVSGGAFNQGRNLHKLKLTPFASLTIPVFPPGC